MARVENEYEDTNSMIMLSEDILDHFVKFLPVKTLCRSAQVCKLWNKVAQKEMEKRGIHSMVITPGSYKLSHVIRGIKTKPKVSLFFCASKPRYRNADNIDYATIYQYHLKFPFLGQRIVLGVEHAMLNTREIRSCNEINTATNRNTMPNGVLGIILPDAKDFTVKTSWCDCNEEFSSLDARTILEELRPDEEKGNWVYLMFGNNFSSVHTHIFDMLRERYPNSQPNVWGGTMANFIKTNDSYPTETEDNSYLGVHPAYLSKHGFLGILLQKPRLRAYSTIIDLSDDWMKKMIEFKKKVRLQRLSLGLVCAPYSSDGSYIYKNIMMIVKCQFPTISFTGFFNSPFLQYYGCDNINTDASKDLVHENVISIMILTYN